MSGPAILHLISPLKHVSPFDINMAVDAGFPTVVPYTGVTLDEVAGLVQDMMFSRSPADAPRTGLFIGGKDAGLALDMLEAAEKAMFPPFVISVFADPAGSFTTAAAMVAKVEQQLKKGGGSLSGAAVHVYGATGVVGGIAGVMAAQAGARVTLVSHRGLKPVEDKAADFKRRFGVDLAAADAPDDAAKRALMPEAEVVLAAGRAGVQILSTSLLAEGRRLKVAADVNAVPPAGIEGLDAQGDGVTLPGGAAGIGALAVGQLKYQVQHQLLRRMRDAGKAVRLSVTESAELARQLAG